MRYESPFWLTFRQALQLGGTMRKGEKSCPIVFWKQTTLEDKESGEPQKKRLLRFYPSGVTGRRCALTRQKVEG